MKEFELPFEKIKATLNDAPVEPTIEITENGTHNVKGYTWADVNVEGGSSDYTTAKLTLVGLPTDNIYVPIAVEIQKSEEETLYTTLPYIDDLEVGVYDVVLYKGSAFLNTSEAITLSGDIESIDGYSYLITGDCTVTITVS